MLDIDIQVSYVDTTVNARMCLDDEVLRLDDEEVTVSGFLSQIVIEKLSRREVDAHRAHQPIARKHRK